MQGCGARCSMPRARRLIKCAVPAHSRHCHESSQVWLRAHPCDQLVNGQAFRVLTVIDNWSRESPVLEVGFRATSSSVAEALSRIGKMVCLLACISKIYRSN
jgi:putative transposase